MYSGWPEYRIRADVNNHLEASLYRCKTHPACVKCNEPIKLTELLNKTIRLIHNVFPIEKACEWREFIRKNVIFANNLQLTDDDINPVLDNICKNEIRPFSGWIWERYLQGSIWRAAPENLSDFEHSPIHELCISLMNNWEQLHGTPKPAHWMFVLQSQTRGDYIGEHSDDHGSRKVAFIYYLTDDDYDYSTEDGVLEYRKDVMQGIVPTFNTFVSWNMPGPLHAVRTYWGTKPRIALVGFVFE